MAEATLTPSILAHLFRNGGIGPELNNEIIDGGHADDASKLTEAMTLSLGTDASGSVSFDGSKDVTLEATVAKATQLRNSQNFSLTGDVTASAIGFNGTGAVALSTKLAAISDSTSSSSSSTAASSAAVKSLNDALSKLTDRVSELEDDISSGVPMMPSSSTVKNLELDSGYYYAPSGGTWLWLILYLESVAQGGAGDEHGDNTSYSWGNPLLIWGLTSGGSRVSSMSFTARTTSGSCNNSGRYCVGNIAWRVS